MNNQGQNSFILLQQLSQQNGRQQQGQFNLPPNITSFSTIGKEKDYTQYGGQNQVLNQHNIQIPSQPIMIPQQKLPKQNIQNTLSQQQPSFQQQLVKNQAGQQIIDFQYTPTSRSSLTQTAQVNPQNPFANTPINSQINSQAAQMTLAPTQAPTLPQKINSTQFLQNNLQSSNSRQTANQNSIVQHGSQNNLQPPEVVQPEITIPLNQSKPSQKKMQQMAFQAIETEKQNTQIQQKRSQYQQPQNLIGQQQGMAKTYIQIPQTSQQQQQQQQNLVQQQISSMHQNINNTQTILQEQPSQQQQQANLYENTQFQVPKPKNSIINSQVNPTSISLNLNYNDFNQQQQKQKESSQKIDQYNNLYPQQQQLLQQQSQQQQQLQQQQRVNDEKKSQVIKENISAIQQQQQQQQQTIQSLRNQMPNQNENAEQEVYSEDNQAQNFINVSKNNKILIVSEKIRSKYEQKDQQNNMITDFDINNWSQEINNNLDDLYEMTLTGHLIKAIQFMNGETSLPFLISITKPFLKNYLRKKSGKPFADGDENRIIKGGLAEYCFQKKDQNQDIWTLNQEKLQTVIKDTNEKLKKYIDNLKKSKGKSSTSIISQDNQANQNFQLQDQQNHNDNFQGTTKSNKNNDKKLKRKNKDKLKDKLQDKQNAHGDYDDQNGMMINEGFDGVNDGNSNIMLSDGEEKKENIGLTNYIPSQIYQKQNKVGSIKQEETNQINQGFFQSPNQSLIQQFPSQKGIDIKIEQQQDRKSSTVGLKQNNYSQISDLASKRLYHDEENQFAEGNIINSTSSKTALYRQHQGIASSNNQFDTNEISQAFNTAQSLNQGGNLSSNQNKQFQLNGGVDQQNEDSIKQKFQLNERQLKCKKVLEQQIKEYKKKQKLDEFQVNKQLKQEFEKKENQDITKSFNQIDQLKSAGMALCYGIFKDQITKMINVIKENQDGEVRFLNQRSKDMKQILQQLSLI